MKRLKLKIVGMEAGDIRGPLVGLGDVSVGREPQEGAVGTNYCLGWCDGERGVGGFCHVTGIAGSGKHTVAGAVAALMKGVREQGLNKAEVEWFLVGGADNLGHTYQGVKKELDLHGIVFREMDVLGRWHRRVKLEPRAGMLTVFRERDRRSGDLDRRSPGYDRRGESVGKAGGVDVRKGVDRREGRAGRRLEDVYAAGDSYDRFQDSKKRIATGASVLFRNADLLARFRSEVLPSVLERGRRLHVWCAGCSVGMEVYSVAILALEWMASKGRQVDFRVLGTDISREALESAARGEYPVSEKVLSEYGHLLQRYALGLENGVIRMGPEVKRAVTFRLRNIQAGSRRHRFEMVICDHVLQYFEEGAQAEFVRSLVRALQPGGFLYVSTPSHRIRECLASDFGLERIGHHFYRHGPP